MISNLPGMVRKSSAMRARAAVPGLDLEVVRTVSQYAIGSLTCDVQDAIRNAGHLVIGTQSYKLLVWESSSISGGLLSCVTR